jgi:hypothetical protein
MQRHKRLLRRTPLKRSSRPILRRTPILRLKPKRLQQLLQYWRRIELFLAAHPWCQHWLAEHHCTAAQALAQGITPPRSCCVHHRNKRTGKRLNQEDYWMAVSWEGHQAIENDKAEARRQGYLLPIAADPEGRLPDGTRALTTSELLAERARK